MDGGWRGVIEERTNGQTRKGGRRSPTTHPRGAKKRGGSEEVVQSFLLSSTRVGFSDILPSMYVVSPRWIRLDSVPFALAWLLKAPYTACGHRMANRKWKASKQQPSMLSGPAVPGYSLVSFHFLWAIHPIRPVLSCSHFFTLHLAVFMVAASS